MFKGIGVAAAAVGLVAAQRELDSLWEPFSFSARRSSLWTRIRSLFLRWYDVVRDLWAEAPTLLSPAKVGLLVLSLVEWVFLPCLSPLSRATTYIALLGLFHIRFALEVFHLSQTSPRALRCFWKRKTYQYVVGQAFMLGSVLMLSLSRSMLLRLLAGTGLLVGGLLQIEEGPFQLTNDVALLKGLKGLTKHSDALVEESRRENTNEMKPVKSYSSISCNSLSSSPSKGSLPPFLQDSHKGEVSFFPNTPYLSQTSKQPSQSKTPDVRPAWEEWIKKLNFLFILALTADLVRIPRADGGFKALGAYTVLLGVGCEILFPFLSSVTFPRVQRTFHIGIPLVIGLAFLEFLRGRP